jgi:hypothetical protein
LETVVPPFVTRAEIAVRFAAVALCALSVGCDKRGPSGTVHGKVSYKGKPVESGTVVFFPADGPVASGDLTPDGSFEVLNYAKGKDLSLGSFKIAVIAGMDQINLRSDDPSYRVEPTIPHKFTRQTSTPLEYEIKEGPNEIVISLDEPPSVKSEPIP